MRHPLSLAYRERSAERAYAHVDRDSDDVKVGHVGNPGDAVTRQPRLDHRPCLVKTADTPCRVRSPYGACRHDSAACLSIRRLLPITRGLNGPPQQAGLII